MVAAPRIGILVVAYNAESTLRSVLSRIPEDFRPRIGGVLISDDHSVDDTYAVGLEVQRRRGRVADHGRTPAAEPRVRRKPEVRVPMGHRSRPRHRGDAARRRAVRARAARRMWWRPIESGEADVVLGSRMMGQGAAGAVACRRTSWSATAILTRVPERRQRAGAHGVALGLPRLRHRRARPHPVRRRTPTGSTSTRRCSCSCTTRALAIAEVPIPTYYGDEICYVEGVPYAADVVSDVLRYRLQQIGFGVGLAGGRPARATTSSPTSCRATVGCSSWIRDRPAGRVLDLGCADGIDRASRCVRAGHHVTGVDARGEHRTSRRVSTASCRRTSTHGLPEEVLDDGGYDLVVAADVLEHVRDPLAAARRDPRSVLAPGGRLLVSVPNFGHWYPRLRVAARTLRLRPPRDPRRRARPLLHPDGASSGSSTAAAGTPCSGAPRAFPSTSPIGAVGARGWARRSSARSAGSTGSVCACARRSSPTSSSTTSSQLAEASPP